MNSRKNKYFIKLITSYSLLLVIVLILGIIFHFILAHNVKQELLNENMLSLKNVTEQYSNCYANIYLISKRMANNTSLSRLAEADQGERAFYYNAYITKQALVDMYSDYSLQPIQTYYIHLRHTDYVISYNDFENLYSFYKNNQMLDPSKYEVWKKTMESSDNYNHFLPLDRFATEYTTHQKNYCYAVPLQNYTFKNINADIIFELNADYMQQMADSIDLMKNGCLIIQDSNDETMLTFSNNESLLEKTDASLLSSLNYTDQGYSSTAFQGIPVTVLHTSAQTPNLNYYLIVPTSSLRAPGNGLQLLSLFIIFLGVVGSFLIIVLLSRANYKPYEAMEYRLQEMDFNHEELVRLNETQKITLRNYYFDQLIHGKIASEEEAAYAQNYLSIPASATSFAILYCNIYLDTFEISSNTQGMINIISPNYADVISDIISSYFSHAHIMQGSHNSIYTVLLYETSEISNVERLFTQIHNTLLEEYNIWAYGGLGCSVDDISSIWKSYRQSKEAIKHISSPNYLCLYREILERHDSFYYPDEIADQLYHFVKSGNSKQIKVIMNFIRDENFKKRKLNDRQLKWLLESISVTLLKIIREDGISCTDPILEILNEEPSLEHCEKLALALCEQTKLPENDNQMICRIQKYIDENYGDQSLCLSRISDLFHISESYFSFLFKKAVGVNFSAYLEQIRMTQAKHLLETTDIKITDLYVAVGYNNLTSFRRAFKKKYGVAPNAIRG